MARTASVVLLPFLLPVLPGGSAAQQVIRPTPEERAAAERAPLFASGEPLAVALETDLGRLRSERGEDRPPQPATIRLAVPGSAEVVIAAEVDLRGNFRREKRNCTFPPLRLILPADGTAGTPFEGERRLKLVAPCRDERDSYQRYVLREYLLYRAFQLLSPASFRVRLMQVTYRDTGGREDPFTRFAFVLEDDDRMADRNDAVVTAFPRFYPGAADSEHAVLVALFQFMIGNTDWSEVVQHNIELIRTRDLRFLTVPYDFDFSGAVDAFYAIPDPSFPIRSVRERLYRGYCREEVDLEPLLRRFRERRPALEALVAGFDPLPEGDRRDMIRYFGTFYDVVDSDALRRREIEEACLAMPA